MARSLARSLMTTYLSTTASPVTLPGSRIPLISDSLLDHNSLPLPWRIPATVFCGISFFTVYVACRSGHDCFGVTGYFNCNKHHIAHFYTCAHDTFGIKLQL